MEQRLVVINLDRTPERFKQFLACNPAFQVERFPAIDGAKISIEQCIRERLITEDNTYLPGALGTALSHATLWKACASGTVPFHIAEDDICLRSDFWTKVKELLNSLRYWDIVLWSHNFDWPAVVTPVVGGRQAAIHYDSKDTMIELEAFRKATNPSILLPLVSAAGIGCYSISPLGAKRMLERCFPIGNSMARFALERNTGWDNTGIDVEMSRHYANQHAFIAMPPLALAVNDHITSTIQSPARPRSNNI